MPDRNDIQTFAAVLFVQVILANSLKVSNEFYVAELVWDGNKYSDIKEFHHETDLDDTISEWPPGPYALPMSIDGCPESTEKGWYQGYIEFTWINPVVVVSSAARIPENTVNADTLSDLRDITLTQLPNIQSNLIGPYSRYKVKLNFCFKGVRNVSLDRGTWPDGNYSIYGDQSGCPDGFNNETVDIQLGKSIHWISDGHVPHFTINRTDESADSLQILECSRTGEGSSAADPFPSRDPFIILKNKNTEGIQSSAKPCASLTGMELTEEFLYSYPFSFGTQRSTHTLTPFLAFCYYYPKQFPIDFTSSDRPHNKIPYPKDSFVVKVMETTTGKIPIRSVDLSEWQSEERTDMSKLLSARLDTATREMWKILDLGRTMSVLALFVPHQIDSNRFRGNTEIVSMSKCKLGCPDMLKCQQWKTVRPPHNDASFPDGTAAAAGNNCRDPLKTGRLFCMLDDYKTHFCEVFRWREPEGKFPRCFIGAGKWDFYHFGAFMSKFEVYYDYNPNNEGFYMILLRPVQGRYISLVGGEDLYSGHNYLDKDTDISVVTNKDNFRDDFQCNMDLGMSDQTIEENQISASSSRQGFPATSSRPFLSSWCANQSDRLRFVTIDLGNVVKIEGITVWNWEDISETISNGTVMKRFLPIGARSISISFGRNKNNVSTYDEKIFRLDALYRVDEPQKFVFYAPFYAQFVRVQVTEPLADNLHCLRFELNGCRTTGSRIVAYSAVHRSLYYENATLLSTVNLVSEEAVITSIGYPFRYTNGESYKWIINFKAFDYIKLIFTNISFNIYEQQEAVGRCDENIAFNAEDQVYKPDVINGYDILELNRNFGKSTNLRFKIDSAFNGRVLSLGTNRTYLTLTFTSCQHFGRFNQRGRGVRALVLKQDIPECFSLENFRPLSNEHIESCNMPTMALSSMSYFNIPYTGLQEKWIIKRNKGYIRFVVKYFDIKCNTGSTFSIKDKFSNEKRFCNIDVLPSEYLTSSNSVNVTFSKYDPNSTEFFRLVCYSIKDSVPETITTKAASIPDIYQSIAREADETADVDLSREISTHWEVTGFDVHATRLLYKVCSRHFDKCYSIFSVSSTWKLAGKECRIRRQRLVSIQSLDELKLIKYILRNFKFLDINSEMFRNAFRHNITKYYYTYIGLHRVALENNARHFYSWESTTPMTFSAWKQGEPSAGDCVRMGFFKADEYNTWETVDCCTAAAFYFVCENSIGNRSIDIQDRVFASEYKGNLSVTVRGFTCQRWDMQYPHTHPMNKDDIFPDELVSDAANFCRGPGRLRDVWCYTTNPEVKHDVCYLNELLEDYSPRTYKGRLRYSSAGEKCAKWSDARVIFDFFNETVDEASNFCRLPVTHHHYKTSLSNPWCFSETDEGVHFCSYFETLSDRCTSTHYVYDGKWNTTFSGKACSEWDAHDEWSNEFYFTDETTTLTDNFCRDPTHFGFLWCFTSDNDHEWEPCYFQYGRNLYIKEEETDMKNREFHMVGNFSCLNGQIVSPYALCNGLVECGDATDEVQCERTVNQLLITSPPLPNKNSSLDDVSLFVCKNNERISFLALCDGVVDCIDASDETDCFANTEGKGVYNNCENEHFQCGDGSCIHLSLVCNFINDCIDASDEICDYVKCGKDEYSCANGQCIANAKRCDAFTDCLDRTDEANCETCLTENTFHCDYVRCVPRRFLCDGYTDCDDGSDEMSCDWSDITSCQDWWLMGYRETGMYTVDPGRGETVRVKCNFDDVLTNNKIYTIFTNVDTMEWEGEKIIFTYMHKRFPYDDTVDMYFNRLSVCTHQVVQSCIPAINSASEIDDPAHNHTYKDCSCIVSNIQIADTPLVTSVTYCDSNVTLLGGEMNKVFFKYFYTVSHRAVSWDDRVTNIDTLQLHVGAMTCAEDFIPESNTVGCSEGRNVFQESVRCLYDVDRSHNIIGCRSGSHLQDCELYQCPTGTIKCPNSYCVPLRFLCDGKRQCPDGEDEKYCGCEEKEREVIILQEDSGYRGPDVLGMAKQLFNTGSIIRLLRYVSEKRPEDMKFRHSFKILRIRDKELKPFELIDREYECKYNVTARDFLNVIQFSKTSTRGLIFVQNSPESQHVADDMFRNITKSPDFFIYRILEVATYSNVGNRYPFVTDVRISNWNKLGPLTFRYFPDLCKEKLDMFCPNAYKCASSKMCITLDHVCDGHIHCIHGDDEQLCNFVCPVGCVCNGFAITCDSMYFNGSVIPVNQYPRSPRSLAIKNSIEGQTLSLNTALDFPLLYVLNLSRCGLEEISANVFIRLSNLRILDISNNLLTKLSSILFKGLKHLHSLNLDGNHQIRSIEAYTFQPLESLRVLRIAETKIKTIVSNTFADLELEHLDLYGNHFDEIQKFGFGNLAAKHIKFESNVISNFDKEIFTGLSSLLSLRTPAYKFCCVRPNYLPEENCFPQKDEFSSCEDLMRISALQTMLWLIGLCALLGNVFAVIYRLIYDRKRLKLGYGVFVTNLAVADFLMGIYMITIAVADAVFRKRYIYMDEYWRNSFWCTFAGVLSTVSSEASVIFLCLITLDRLLVIKYPFGQFRFDTKKALMSSAVAWVIAVIIAVFPVMHTTYFKNKFYTKSGVCIALPLTKDRPPGWLYSVFIFVCFNFVTFVLIALGQWSIYMDIRKSKLVSTQSSRKKDLTVSRNLLLVVATDFMCWFPIGCIGMMAMSGHIISGDVYAWAAVFILPVNSALNPFLYTLPAIFGKKNFTPRTGEQLRNRVRTDLGKRFLSMKKFICQHFYVHEMSRTGSFVSLRDVLLLHGSIDLNFLLMLSHQIAEIARVLHDNSLVLGKLDQDTIFILVEGNKILGNVQIRQEPTLFTKQGDKFDDMYQLGLLLQSLIVKHYEG